MSFPDCDVLTRRKEKDSIPGNFFLSSVLAEDDFSCCQGLEFFKIIYVLQK